MTARTALYETIFILHPELTEEEAEETVQNLNKVLEDRGSETIRIERGGKRRLAYPIRKQRYGYYNLIHFRSFSDALLELERVYRLSDRVLRYMSVRYEKEEQMTGFTRLPDDDGRDEGRDDRRRMGRYRGGPEDRDRDRDRRPPREEEPVADAETDEEPDTPEAMAEGQEESENAPEMAEVEAASSGEEDAEDTD